MTSVKYAVNSFLENYNLKNKKLCLGFSGGYDSICLLHVLFILGCEVIAAHLNHNWRGAESEKEEENCRRFCKKFGIEFYSETLPSEIHRTETAARSARYDFFERCIKMFNADAFLTAHNADDNAETVIYRIVKGTGIDGLCAIMPKRDMFYRPLLTVRRNDIEKYCIANNLNPNIDSSNENTKYNRNLIRHEIFPLLNKINPKSIEAINSLSELARNDCEMFARWGNCTRTREFLKFPKALQGRVIKKLLTDKSLDCNRKRIELLTDFILDNSSSKSGNKCSLGLKLWFYVNNEEFCIVKEQEKNSLQIGITKEGEYSFGKYVFSIQKCSYIPEEFPRDDECIAYVMLEKINLILRTRRNGDRITLLGGAYSQKLKKYLNEKKIPFYKKDNLPLLCAGQEVMWVPGFGINDKIKVVDKCVTHVLKLVKNGDGK